ncbi:MAG: Fic family protein [Patescibacteria group bacterium]
MPKRPGETSYKETAFGVIPRSALIRLEVEGIARAWTYVLKMTKPGTRITPEHLQHLHRIGFGWIFPDTAGRFRRVEVEVSAHQPPAFYRVPQQMVDFCEDLKERLKHLSSIDEPSFLDSLVDLLSWTHHRFLWIHPFLDYNGRIARLLTNVILLKLGLPPIELNVETTQGRLKYIRALQAGDVGDMKPLQKLIRRAIDEAVAELQNI